MSGSPSKARKITRKRARSVRTPKHLKGMEHIVFLQLLRDAGVTAPVGEYQFALTGADPRKFALDYAWPAVKLAVEVEGGVWVKGAHGRGSGIMRDMEKQNCAVLEGWRVLRYTPSQLILIHTVATIRAALSIPSTTGE